MTIDVSPTSIAPTHHISLDDGLGNKYGLILTPDGRAIQRRPKNNSQGTPFTQSDWSGGRGIKEASTDASRYADSKRLITRRAGYVTLAGQEVYTNNFRQAEQFMPANAGGVTWQALTGSQLYIDFQTTASGSGNRTGIFLWIRRRGTPTANLSVRLLADNSNVPGSQLKLVQVSVSDITDTLSLLYYFPFSSMQAVTSATKYWIEVQGASTDTAANHWEVGVDASHSKGLTKISDVGHTTWTSAAYDLYYRLVDDLELLGSEKFMYKGQLYKITKPANGGTPHLYMNGYRGVATGAGQSRTQLQDTTQTWAVNELVGKTILFIDGPCSELNIQYKIVTANTNNAITFSTLGNTPVAAQTIYVILGCDKWIEITGHGLTVAPTSIASAGEQVYFAQGDSVQMRKMIEYNLNGVWTRTFAVEDNYAKLLMPWKSPTSGMVLFKANDYDNVGRPAVSYTPFVPWGTRLKFPWLIDACTSTSNWTAAANVTLAVDTVLYKTKNASLKITFSQNPGDVICYRTFSALNLKNQKTIRLWVYTDTDINEKNLQLRLSLAANCSSTNPIEPEINFPALPAGEWTQVTLAIKDHGISSITGVKTVGLVNNGGSLAGTTIRIDTVEAVPGGTEVALGNELERITGLNAYGDPEVPWVFRTASVGSIENDTFNPIPLQEYTHVENPANGAASVVFDVYLFFSFLRGLEQYYRSNLDDVGPNRDEGLPNERQGYISSMIGYPGRIFAAMDGGDNGYSSIFEFKGGSTAPSYHEIYRCDVLGARIGGLAIQVIQGNSADRLWFSQGNDTVYLPLPGNTGSEYNDTTYRFTNEGALTTGWIAGPEGEQMLYASVKLTMENVGANQYIEWDYKLDSDSNPWIPVSTNFNRGPVQEILLNVIGKRMQIRFRLQSASNTATPNIRRMTVSATTRPVTHYSYSMNFVYRDNGVDLNNQVENYTRVETLLNQLDAWMLANTPLTMHSIWSPIDNKIVYLDPVVMNPAANLPDQQQEQMTATLVAIEP